MPFGEHDPVRVQRTNAQQMSRRVSCPQYFGAAPRVLLPLAWLYSPSVCGNVLLEGLGIRNSRRVNIYQLPPHPCESLVALSGVLEVGVGV